MVLKIPENPRRARSAAVPYAAPQNHSTKAAAEGTVNGPPARPRRRPYRYRLPHGRHTMRTSAMSLLPRTLFGSVLVAGLGLLAPTFRAAPPAVAPQQPAPAEV